jgi:hypothetical protein
MPNLEIFYDYETYLKRFLRWPPTYSCHIIITQY